MPQGPGTGLHLDGRLLFLNSKSHQIWVISVMPVIGQKPKFWFNE
jgi:hypothetical protein